MSQKFVVFLAIKVDPISNSNRRNSILNKTEKPRNRVVLLENKEKKKRALWHTLHEGSKFEKVKSSGITRIIHANSPEEKKGELRRDF